MITLSTTPDALFSNDKAMSVIGCQRNITGAGKLTAEDRFHIFCPFVARELPIKHLLPVEKKLIQIPTGGSLTMDKIIHGAESISWPSFKRTI